MHRVGRPRAAARPVTAVHSVSHAWCTGSAAPVRLPAPVTAVRPVSIVSQRPVCRSRSAARHPAACCVQASFVLAVHSSLRALLVLSVLSALSRVIWRLPSFRLVRVVFVLCLPPFAAWASFVLAASSALSALVLAVLSAPSRVVWRLLSFRLLRVVWFPVSHGSPPCTRCHGSLPCIR